eukprot:COSAG01_NODE_15074_length_1377_cov_10.768388_3_plen_116_part_00
MLDAQNSNLVLRALYVLAAHLGEVRGTIAQRCRHANDHLVKLSRVCHSSQNRLLLLDPGARALNPAVQLLRTAPQTLLTSAHLHPNPHAQDVRLTGGTDHQAHQESHLAGWGPGG